MVFSDIPQFSKENCQANANLATSEYIIGLSLEDDLKWRTVRLTSEYYFEEQTPIIWASNFSNCRFHWPGDSNNSKSRGE
jgi:hypothetical protein